MTMDLAKDAKNLTAKFNEDRFSDFESWKTQAELLGWVHVHDDIVVCDDPDSGEVLGEFNSENNSGWLSYGDRSCNAIPWYPPK
jgi:hypothetical protein